MGTRLQLHHLAVPGAAQNEGQDSASTSLVSQLGGIMSYLCM